MVRVEERWLGYERQSAHTGMIVRLCMGMCISNTAGVNNEHSFKSRRGVSDQSVRFISAIRESEC